MASVIEAILKLRLAILVLSLRFETKHWPVLSVRHEACPILLLQTPVTIAFATGAWYSS